MAQGLVAGEVVDRLRTLYSVSTDKALATAMGVPTTTVSSWRSRNRVPYDECVVAVRKFRCSFDWLFLGIGAEPGLDMPYAVHERSGTDPRLRRLTQFIGYWQSTHGEDEKAWLEMQVARAVPEYTEWVAQRSRTGN